MSAVESWNERVESHHAQSARIQESSDWSSDDFWQPLASMFKADPARTDDPLLNRMLRLVGPESTVLDVGGGAGRFALPLALRTRHVTVVEPSDSMIDGLNESAREAGIENIDVVQANWDDAEVGSTDVVLCAHVVYGVADIEPFLRKLHDHAKERVAILAFTESPLSAFSPLWNLIHGEERIDLPALPELLDTLWEMCIYPDMEMLEEPRDRTAESREKVLGMLRHFLFVIPETEQDRQLQASLSEVVDETTDGLLWRESRARRQALLTWSPA